MTTIIGEHQGEQVLEAVLESGPMRLAILNYGCVIRDWRLGDLPVCLGFERFEDYPGHSPSFGVIAGRVANRIAAARFRLEGQQFRLTPNDGPNHLHGGQIGLGRRLWLLEEDSAAQAVQLRYHSPDGEEGYPGTVDFSVTYRLSGSRLICEMEARPDRPTPLNLAQHNYYNLAGTSDVLDHELRIDAERYLPVDDALIPTGAIAPVAGTRFDFSEFRRIGDADAERAGHDHNYCLRAARDRGQPAAELRGAGRHLRIWTDQPGLQLYTARPLDLPVPGIGGRRYGPYAGLCLEAQHWPDAVNQPGFPAIIHTPDRAYFQRLEVEIAMEG